MRILVASALTAALATAAAADPPRSAPPGPARAAAALHDDDCARARAQHRTCVLTIGGEDVGGTTPVATGSTIRVVTPGKEPSLLPIRREFIVQIIQSADGL